MKSLLTFSHSLEIFRVCTKLQTLENVQVSCLNTVVDHLPIFTSLRKIELTGDYGHDSEMSCYGQCLVNMMKKLPFLKELELDRIPVDEDTLSSLIRSASQLKVLHVSRSQVTFCDELISQLAATLKYNRQKSNEALQLYLDKNDFDKLDMVNWKNTDNERYLQLKLIEY